MKKIKEESLLKSIVLETPSLYQLIMSKPIYIFLNSNNF